MVSPDDQGKFHHPPVHVESHVFSSRCTLVMSLVVNLKYPIENGIVTTWDDTVRHLASFFSPCDCRQAQDARRHGRHGKKEKKEKIKKKRRENRKNQ